MPLPNKIVRGRSLFLRVQVFYQASSRSDKGITHSFFSLSFVLTLLPSFRHLANATFIIEKASFVHVNLDTILHPQIASSTLFA